MIKQFPPKNSGKTLEYKIVYKNSVGKDIRSIPKEIIRKSIDIIENKISKNPYIGMQLKGKYKELWKYRIQNYRVIYTIDSFDKKILILRIRHRKEVYNNIF
ncbi:MAG: type II toxin-antitoxin system RelE/ParE family toxin [Candidatus Firestonebacteria bacterium]